MGVKPRLIGFEQGGKIGERKLEDYSGGKVDRDPGDVVVRWDGGGEEVEVGGGCDELERSVSMLADRSDMR